MALNPSPSNNSKDRPVSVMLSPLTWRANPPQGGVAVVIDVLRATTSMVAALAAGAARILPTEEVDDAFDLRSRLDDEDSLLVGERGGRPIDGFDLGNSPAEFTPERVLGKTMIWTTTNGTRALLACRGAEGILLGSFVNLGSLAEALLPGNQPVTLVCAGIEGGLAIEDVLCAGAILDILASNGAASPWGDDAQLALAAFRGMKAAGRSVYQSLQESRDGVMLAELGYASDVAAAAEVDRYRLVARVMGPDLSIHAE